MRYIHEAMIKKEELQEDGLLIQLGPQNSLGQAQAALRAKPGRWAIVVDEEERPVSVITADDLPSEARAGNLPLREFFSQLPPGVVTITDATLEAFVESPEFTAFAVGSARAAVVYQVRPEGVELAGLLTEETIDTYLILDYRPIGQTKGPGEVRSLWSSALAGDIVEEPVVKFCADFNHRNELTYVPRQSPDCVQTQPYRHPIWR